MGAVWGPLVLVSWHWAYVGMSIGWEPGASLRGAVQGSGREDFIDGPFVGVAIVLGRGAKTDPRGWAVVVEAGQGLEGVAGDGVVVPWEIDPWVSSDDQCGGPQGAGEHEREGAVLVGEGLEMLLVG